MSNQAYSDALAQGQSAVVPPLDPVTARDRALQAIAANAETLMSLDRHDVTPEADVRQWRAWIDLAFKALTILDRRLADV